ncbi:MAG: AAA family ATPase [Polyangiaceae bacterium]|nr:AAA family ATPase [Polyangiaceae bacterium]
MRFLALDLIAFGPFTNASLDFSTPERALHVIYGPNEAGKSTTLRAVTGLLYGIPKNTVDAHLHKMPELRVGARLIDAHGASLHVIRRKGNVNTLLDPAGSPVDEARLKKMLGGVSEELFGQMFGLNHETLRHGGEALLAGKGNLGESLFGAGLGGGGLQQLLQDLKKEAEELFTPQATKRPLNEAIRALSEAQKRAKDAALPPEVWVKQKQGLEDALAERGKIEAKTRELQAQQNRLRRAKRVLPLLAKRRLLLERKAALGEVIGLGPRAAQEREEALRQIHEAAAQIERLGLEIEELEARRGAIKVPHALLEQEALIEDLQGRIGGHRKASGDLPRLRAELELAQHEAKSILRKLHREVPLEEVEALRVDAATQARIKKLAPRLAVLEEKGRAARRAQEDAERRLAELGEKLAALPEARDGSGLWRALARAQKQGDLEARLRKAAGEEQRLEAMAEGRLSALGLFRGPLAALSGLSVPSQESVDRAAEELAGLEKQRERLEEETEALERRRLDLERGIDELQRGGAVPTEEELENARGRRDEAWERVRAALGGRSKESASLAEAYEARVKEADALGDRLRREAERVAKLANLLADRAATERRARASESERARVSVLAGEAAERWRAMWRPCGFEPLSPAEMRGWIVKHAALVSLAEQKNAAARDREDLARQIGEHREELEEALSALGELSEGPRRGRGREVELSALVAHAERTAAAIERAGQRRLEVEQGLLALAKERERLARDRAEGDEELSAWKKAWGKAVAPLGLGEDASTEEATAIVEELSELFRKVGEIEKAVVRVEGMERDAGQFEADVEAAAREHAPELVSEPADQAAAQLIKRYQQGAADLAERNQLDRELYDRRRKLDEQRARKAGGEARLLDLMRAAAANDLAALEAAERRSQEFEALARGLNEAEEQLIQAGEGAGLRELIQETAGVDADRLAADVEEVEARLAEIEEQRRQNDMHIGSVKAGLDHLGGVSLAAEAAAEAQECLARVRGLSERYLRARLAELILGREIERYRERNQGPILTRASELFRRLTLGAFTGLKAGYDEKDTAVLKCVRNRPGASELLVSDLSDGTRDQLFLSLRLASLERYAETNEPMPLIVDDILVHFDDDRSRATLEVLGSIAERTQVLFFTHHARLLELARRAVPEDRLREHRLSGPAAALHVAPPVP